MLMLSNWIKEINWQYVKYLVKKIPYMCHYDIEILRECWFAI